MKKQDKVFLTALFLVALAITVAIILSVYPVRSNGRRHVTASAGQSNSDKK